MNSVYENAYAPPCRTVVLLPPLTRNEGHPELCSKHRADRGNVDQPREGGGLGRGTTGVRTQAEGEAHYGDYGDQVGQLALLQHLPEGGLETGIIIRLG